MNYKNKQQLGMSLVEVVIVAAVATIVFGALMMSFKYSLDLMNVTRSKLSALSVANDRMEFFRSLPYADVGTVLGIPSGTIPQTSTTSLNGIEFAERVLVEYVDDPGDGLAGDDNNGIITDYKRVKLEYTWEIGGATSSISLVSNIVPRSIETDGGGGTVRINVIDENSNLLPGASVRLFNNTIGPVDVTRFTDTNGSAIISGAEAGGDYEIEVGANIGGNEYSTARTYRATAAVPNPVVSPFAVLEADVSTLTFQIGELSDLDITTYSTIDDGLFTETFDSLTTLATSTNVEITSGELRLDQTAGVYENSGSLIVGPISPTTIDAWHSVRLAIDSPGSTSYYTKLLTELAPGIFGSISDSELPGNLAGFTSSIIDLQDLSPVMYPELFVSINLATSDTSVTPSIDELNMFYRESTTVLPNAAFAINGTKIVGTDSAAAPVYKYTNSLITDSGGEENIPDLEFDNYTLDFSGYDIATACGGHPINHQAGVDSSVELELVAGSSETLRVWVTDAAARPLPGVELSLSRPGYSDVLTTNNCGQVFFTGSLTDASDYVLTVAAAGYADENLTDVTVSGNTALEISLSE